MFTPHQPLADPVATALTHRVAGLHTCHGAVSEPTGPRVGTRSRGPQLRGARVRQLQNGDRELQFVHFSDQQSGSREAAGIRR